MKDGGRGGGGRGRGDVELDAWSTITGQAPPLVCLNRHVIGGTGQAPLERASAGRQINFEKCLEWGKEAKATTKLPRQFYVCAQKALL